MKDVELELPNASPLPEEHAETYAGLIRRHKKRSLLIAALAATGLALAATLSAPRAWLLVVAGGVALGSSVNAYFLRVRPRPGDNRWRQASVSSEYLKPKWWNRRTQFWDIAAVVDDITIRGLSARPIPEGAYFVAEEGGAVYLVAPGQKKLITFNWDATPSISRLSRFGFKK